jgi:hypothetical protein
MRRLPALAILASIWALAGTAGAKVFLTADQALEAVFGSDARIERRTHFLTDPQLEAARQMAGRSVELQSALVTRYRAVREGRLLGTAYFDTHRVRTLQETVMIVVDPAGRIGQVEILSFYEPEDYIPRRGWLDQFLGRRLEPDLAVKRGIHGITGATLSAEAITVASRRVLALHQVLEPDAQTAGASREVQP